MRRPSPGRLIMFVTTSACCAAVAVAMPALGRATADDTTTISTTVAGHLVTLTIPAARACVAGGGPLRLTLRARAESGDAHFTRAQLYLDRGYRVVYHHDARRHGRLRSVRTVAYVANELIRSLPATVSVSLHGVTSGPHILRALVVYITTAHRDGRLVTRTSSARLSLRFRVC